jgi:hypothetical protein
VSAGYFSADLICQFYFTGYDLVFNLYLKQRMFCLTKRGCMNNFSQGAQLVAVFVFILFILLTTSRGALAALSSGSLASVDSQVVVSYQAWKSARIEEALKNVERLNVESRSTLPNSGPQQQLGSQNSGNTSGLTNSASAATPLSQAKAKLDARVAHGQQNLEIAKELSVNDYFVLYLSQLKSKEAFVEVAKKLSHDELAELMMVFQRTMNNSITEAATQPPSVLPTKVIR